jgi:dihydroneopterin aldolase
VHAQHGHVGADERLAHKRGQNSGVVADMTFSLRDRVTTDDGDDTLKYVILMPGVLSYES